MNALTIFLAILGIIIIIIGILAIPLGRMLDKECTDYQGGFSEKATGTVVNIYEVYSGMYTNKAPFLVPEIRYSFNGNDILARPTVAQKNKSYYIGQSIDIIYNPADPHNIYLSGPIIIPQNSVSTFSTIIGITLIPIGLVFIAMSIIISLFF